MQRMMLLVALVAAFAPGLSRAVAPSDAAAAHVTKIQQYYDGTKDLHAHFDQVVSSSMGGAKKASGEVWLKKPGRMRWDYDKPEKKLMVADGQTLWVYEPEDEQAFKQALTSSSLPASVSFLLGQGRLREEFQITMVDSPEAGLAGPGEVVLKLVPKTATTAYRHLLFVVDGKSGQVVKTVIYDQQGGQNRLSFSAIETNRGVDDTKFRFTPPAGTRILSPNSPNAPAKP